MRDDERREAIEERSKEQPPPHETVPSEVPGTDISHPAGTILGGTGGAVAGGTLGALAGGPVGAAVGAVIGGVAGAMGGRVAGENLNPEDEDAYWRENYYKLDYVAPEDRYEDYAPAYRFGRKARGVYRGRTYEDIEVLLERDWEKAKGDSRLGWDRANRAIRDAWNRAGEEA